ncbi:uncharacterized protein PHALS_01364 [Plasmopara halstedii]|uniref:Uncharacterized protein n=1 Tax=Plasmopara halstedii TaxID=4781 RepID=A0A0N7L5K8_PLAHL|nr:uncharacterized protein PHALS_12084 [Plasmopara halstedii]XP_024581406.1 uncharacterized protein PHALS_01364 [Plasmopara halstedii]CEG41755.1 hypothetical protein PHALS_12084 [Plasmopara halstedii]CEG45037.1 hypothetical protein PHALS_01364 [Plasmopara halstedii]|eukprot:XP_024578124.1 hypothetical protein PHALS_12084 [Plasmopara halstedii]
MLGLEMAAVVLRTKWSLKDPTRLRSFVFAAESNTELASWKGVVTEPTFCFFEGWEDIVQGSATHSTQ